MRRSFCRRLQPRHGTLPSKYLLEKVANGYLNSFFWDDFIFDHFLPDSFFSTNIRLCFMFWLCCLITLDGERSNLFLLFASQTTNHHAPSSDLPLPLTFQPLWPSAALIVHKCWSPFLPVPSIIKYPVFIS